MSEESDKLRDLLRGGMAATENGDYKTGYKALSAFYGTDLEGLPVDGLSYFGLCVAVVEKQTRKGVELCQAAIKAQFYQPAHYTNLVKLYLERDDRRNAVKVLEQGLKRMPEDQRLNKIKSDLGYRRPPVFPFLARRNPLNILFGKIRTALKR